MKNEHTSRNEKRSGQHGRSRSSRGNYQNQETYGYEGGREDNQRFGYSGNRGDAGRYGQWRESDQDDEDGGRSGYGYSDNSELVVVVETRDDLLKMTKNPI